MTYITGTFPTGVSTRDAFKSVFDAALTGAGWSILGDFAESDYANYVGASTLYRVYRSTVANSGAKRDLYITVYPYETVNNAASTGDQQMCLVLSHDFDPATSTLQTGQNNDYYAKTDASGYPVWSAPRKPRYVASTNLTVVSGGQYFISVSPKRLIMAARSAANAVSSAHLGYVSNLFPTTIANADTPAWAGVLEQVSTQYGNGSGSWLREPGAQVTGDGRQIFGSNWIWPPMLSFDTKYYGGYIGVRPYLCHYRENQSIPRGQVEGLIVVADPGAQGTGTPGLGDFLTIDGTKFVCFKPGAGAGYPHFFIDTTL